MWYSYKSGDYTDLASGSIAISEDEPENARGRLRYEQARFADPAIDQIPHNVRRKELNFARNLPIKPILKSTDSWNLAGPYNVGGRTRALALDIIDENTLLAGGVTGGLYKSTDGGTSFRRVTSPNELQSITCLAQDRRPGFSNIWYYGTGEAYGVISAASFSNVTGGNGIYRSLDNGESWLPLISTQSHTPELNDDGDFDIVWRIVTDPTITDQFVVVAATSAGIFYSNNAGDSWEKTLDTGSAPNSSVWADLIITPQGIYYATLSSPAINKGLYRSDNGIEWTEITPTAWPSAFYRTILAASPCDSDEIYFFSNLSQNGNDLHSFWKYNYISGDGSGNGGTWENRSANLPDCSCTGFYNFEFCSINSQEGYDMALAVLPDCNGLVLGGTNIYYSPDAFSTSTWNWVGGYYCDESTPSNYVYPQHHPDIHSLIISPADPEKVYSASDGGIHYTHDITADNVLWNSLNFGYITTQFYTLAIEPGAVDNDIIIGGLQDNGTLFTHQGNEYSHWTKIMYGDGAYAAISPGREYYYLSWQTGKTFKCTVTDEGDLTGMERIDPGGSDADYNFINPFILDPLNENRMYLLKGNTIYRHDALDTIAITGNEYTPLSGWVSIPGASVSSGNLFNPAATTCIAMTPSLPNTVYYGTNFGKLYRLDNADNNSLVSRTDLTGTIFGSGYISSISINESQAQEILVSKSNYNTRSIFYSLDGGNNWTDVGGNLEENTNGSGSGPSVIWTLIRENTSGEKTFYAGTSVGLYSTTILEGSNTEWQQESPDGIGHNIINMMVYRSYDDRLVVATHGNGVYQNKTMDTGISNHSLTAPLSLSAVSPATDDLVLILSDPGAAYYRVSLYTLGGDMLFTDSGYGAHYKRQGLFNDLPPAIYIVEVMTALRKGTVKIAVTR